MLSYKYERDVYMNTMLQTLPDIFDLVNQYSQYQNGTISASSLIVTIIAVICTWRLFDKANLGGWRSIIPIYNVYTYCKMIKLNFWLIILSFILLFIPIIGIVAAIYLIYVLFAFNFRLSRAFGHGFLFGLGLIFLNPIFMLILAFSGDKYTPNNI